MLSTALTHALSSGAVGALLGEGALGVANAHTRAEASGKEHSAWPTLGTPRNALATVVPQLAWGWQAHAHTSAT
jgi:hypothetical protein